MNFNGKNILVTGGAGFIGSVLVTKLLNKGFKVRVLDNLMYQQISLLPLFVDPNFEFIKGDIRNIDTIKKCAKDVDIIVHLAAIVGAPACRKDKRLAEEVNYQGTVNIDKARNKSQGIIFTSTGSNYGIVKGVCTEETPLNPISTYGVTKTNAEKYLMDSENVVLYRFATGFGLSPRPRLDLLINDFVFQAVKNGYLFIYEKNFRRTFIHVQDMARSILHAIENFDSMKDQIFNVGSEKLNLTKEQLANEIKKKVDFFLEFAEIGSDPDKRDYEVSYKKIRSTGFDIKFDLDMGLDELIKGCQMIYITNPHSNVLPWL